MNTLSSKEFGYPMIDGYTISTDLALVRSEYQSNWRRQRRSYVHNASLFTVTYKLTIAKAQALNNFLQAQPDTDFFLCDLISGNDDQSPCVVQQMEIRRTSEVGVRRIPLTNFCNLTFEAECLSQVGYQEKATAAANLPPQVYPSNLPLPLAEGFTSTHGGRNVTKYSLTYVMTAQALEDWLAFAGFMGTAWFTHPMVSPNVLCGYELIRYITSPTQTLIGPNKFSVTIEAESIPAIAILDDLIFPPTGECTYDADLFYDDADESYDCGDTPPPPQGNFTMPTGPISITSNATGNSPQTSTGILKLMRDGSVISTPQSVPAWPTWHTAPLTLLSPAVSFNQVVEFSLDGGQSWRFSTPVPGGLWLSLKGQDVWIRQVLTGTFDQSKTLTLDATFEADKIPSPVQFSIASITFVNSIDITDPGGSGSVVDGASFSDGYTTGYDPVEPPDLVEAGVIFYPDGRVTSVTTGLSLGIWFTPITANAGASLWIILNGTGNANRPQQQPVSGVMTSLASANTIRAYKPGYSQSGTGVLVQWSGTYEIYNAQVGGTKLGGGTISLLSEAIP